jgi:S-adenosyl methyltransferase
MTTTAIQADMRSPQAILDNPETRRMLDFDQPMAVLLISILHFIEDAEDPEGLVAQLRDAVVPGSYLAISHLTTDLGPGAQQVARLFDRAAARMVPRSGAQIEGFFGGWEMVEPGMVQLPLWRPDEPIPDNLDKIWFYGAVARKP